MKTHEARKKNKSMKNSIKSPTSTISEMETFRLVQLLHIIACNSRSRAVFRRTVIDGHAKTEMEVHEDLQWGHPDCPKR